MQLIAGIISSIAVLFIVVFLAIPMHDQHGHLATPKMKLLLSVLPLAVWPLLMPLFYLMVKFRSRAAVDTLVRNVSTMASQ